MTLSTPPHHRLLFLHGWGQSSQIWHQQRNHFSDAMQAIDLPGHGNSRDIDIELWLDHLEQQLLASAQPLILVGWSLGGQLAIALEQRLKATRTIKALVLIATTPCFRQQADWPHGCSDEIWQGFNDAAMQQDPRLMQRFFQMMLHGDTLSRSQRNSIGKETIDRHSPPSPDGLKNGLAFLSELDLRDALGDINIPTLVIHGQQDIIVPVAAGQFLAANIASSELTVFQECGHAPFLTHHAKFNQLLEQWCKNLSM